MSWQSKTRGKATYESASPCGKISVDARGGTDEARWWICGRNGIAMSLRDAAGYPLPSAGDSYARGSDFIVRLPQTSKHAFTLTLQTSIIADDARQTVVETIVEMQTDRLDAHPAVVLRVPSALEKMDTGQWRLTSLEKQVDLLQTPRDAASAQVQPLEVGKQQVRIFGGFLEKGVIQKWRGWWVLWHHKTAHQATRDQWYTKLCEAPLPLTT